MSAQTEPRIPLPKSWNKHVRSSLLHVISLAQFAVAYTRGWAANSINPRLRQKSRTAAPDRDRRLVARGNPYQGCPHGTHLASSAATISACRKNGDSGTACRAGLVATTDGKDVSRDRCHHRLLDEAYRRRGSRCACAASRAGESLPAIRALRRTASQDIVSDAWARSRSPKCSVAQASIWVLRPWAAFSRNHPVRDRR